MTLREQTGETELMGTMINETSTHNSDLAIELFLLNAWREKDMDRLSALVPCDNAEVNANNRFCVKTVC